MAFDTYMEIPEIKGEATGLKDGIEILSFSWGASAPVTVGAGTGGISASRVDISSFSFIKRTDKASADLFLHCCQGIHLPTVTIHMRKQTGTGGQQDFLTYTFTEVMVESVQWSGSSGGDDTPTESVSLAFGKVALSYPVQDKLGKLAAGGDASWDLTTVATK